jgi:hypothetical protein
MGPDTTLGSRMAMTCPICHVALQPNVRQSIEIDYCPQCRGVWLDRGELDKIIEREAAGLASLGRAGGDAQPRDYPPQARPVDPGYRRRDHDDDDDDRYRSNQGHGYGPPRKKRGGFLGELFDFD